MRSALPRDSWSLVVPFAVVSALAVAAYANSLSGGLPLDAGALVQANPALRAFTWENLRSILTSDYWSPMATNGLYRPLTTLSLLANWTLLGNEARPLGYHLVNLLLHVAGAGAALALFRRAGLAAVPATLAAAFFAVHPVTTEVVANVAGRADLLAALGVLGGLLCHAAGRDAVDRARIAWDAGLVAATVLAAFSKENGVVLLPLVIAWDAAIRPRPTTWRAWVHGPARVAPVVALMLAAHTWVRVNGYPPESSSLDNPLLDAGFWTARATALDVLARQAALLVWPVTLRADYSADQIPLLGWPPDTQTALRVGLGLALFVLLPAAAWRIRRTRPALAFFLVWIAVTVLPTANLLVLVGSIRAERFLYLPLVGCAGALAVAAWGDGTRQRRRAVLAAGSVVLVLAGMRTIRRNFDWRDDFTLWQATVATSPRNAKAHRGLGLALAARGAPGDRLRAIAEAEAATTIRPDYLHAWVDIATWALAEGDAAAAGGDDDAAGRWYRRAIEVLRAARPLDRRNAARFRRAMQARGREAIPRSGYPALYETEILVCARLGQWSGVLAAARYLQRLDPWRPLPHVDASAAYFRVGRLDDAAVSLHAAQVLGGGADVEARLAAVYRTLGDGGARGHRCRALRMLARLFADAALPGEATRLEAAARDACAAAGS